ncbi:cytochrome c biogenesis protein CcdA [Microbacteriaceae bacterium MWH-Ta3]|nr:cytochrome c biogenesis protein CcdA [Microbacteriaceae bacterium MWH-Ta3]
MTPDAVGEIVYSGGLIAALPVAFVAGLLAFLSPCVLPLIPGYLAYIGGVNPTADASPTARRRTVLGMIGFVSGFGVVFISLSIVFGALGLMLLPWLDLILRVSGAVIIVMGIVFIGGIPFLQRDLKPEWRTRAGIWGAPFLGIVFALGWVPCIGPTLIAVQTLALDSASVPRAAALGVAYWLGLALPFVLVAILLQRATATLSWLRRHIRTINIAGGVLLMIIGVLMVIGVWRDVLSWMGVIISGFTPAL